MGDVASASSLLNNMATPADLVDTLRGIKNAVKPGGRFIGITMNPTTKWGKDQPKDWFRADKYGINCYGTKKPREQVESGGMVSCDINKMDGTDDPIHLDIYHHHAIAFVATKGGKEEI